MIYADYNATAPLRPEARAAMVSAMDLVGNASSVHRCGRSARRVVETARVAIGEALGSRPEDIVFTSGGTEALHLAMRGCGEAVHYLYSDLEHDAVVDLLERRDLPRTLLPVTPAGLLDLEALAQLLDARPWGDAVPVLLLQIANNETGVIQPVMEASALVREAGGLSICDGVQGLGKIDLRVAMLGADYLALSAHKAGGPQGVGALWARPGAPLKPVQLGGGQEKSRRSGTENVIGIAGFGAAVRAATSSEGLAQMAGLAAGRDRFEQRIAAAARVTVFGDDVPRLPNTSCLALEGLSSETQVMAMDLEGVAISAGAACSSGKVRPSRVLKGMGASDALASAAVRFSFGWDTAEQDFEHIAQVWMKTSRRANASAFKETV